MKKSLAATAIAATTLGGVAAGATLFTPVIAGAQDAAETETVAPGPSRVSVALQGLVDDGTIDEAQRDAVVAALQEARSERGHRGPGFRGAGVVADTLGLDGSELRDALQSGQSLADVAAEQGVAEEDLVAAIVDQVEERVNGAVDAGRIDDEKAAEILAGAQERAEAIVSGDFEPGDGGFGRRGPGRPGGPAGFPGGDTEPTA